MPRTRRRSRTRNSFGRPGSTRRSRADIIRAAPASVESRADLQGTFSFRTGHEHGSLLKANCLVNVLTHDKLDLNTVRARSKRSLDLKTWMQVGSAGVT